MSLSNSESFKVAASPRPSRNRQRPAPFSIRLSAEERAALERKAGHRPLGAYIRGKLLGDTETRRKATRAPSIDYAVLGQILGLLGKSDQVQCLFLLVMAAEAGRIQMTPEERGALRSACADVQEMRGLLVKALGLKSGGAP